MIRYQLLLLLVLTAILSADAPSSKFKGPDPKKAITQFTHEVWQADHGLPQNSITAIQQTGDGFLWLGTQEGLVRFDGVMFTVFDKNNTPQIKNNHIVSLAINRSGTLIIATHNEGLVAYRNGIFMQMTGVPQLDGTQLRDIHIDSRGSFWVSTRDSGIVRIDTTSITHFTTRDGLVSNNVWDVAEDAAGRFWVATEGGISVITKDTILSFTQQDGIMSRENFGLLPLPGGEVWIGGRNGMQKVTLNHSSLHETERYTRESGLAGTGVYEMLADRQGNIWVCGDRGLTRIHNGTLSTFTTKEGLSEQLLNAAFVDREGNLWIGTDGGGLNVLKDGIFTSYSVKEGMPHNNTWTVFEDRKLNLWVGTDEGLVLFDQTTGVRRVYTRKDGMSHRLIWSLAGDTGNGLWVGTINGLNRIVNERIVPLPKELQFDDQAINTLLTDRNGVLWVGTSGNGLYAVHDNRRTKIGSERGITSEFINVLAEDRNGNILIGTDGDGLLILRNDTVRARYTVKDGLTSNFIYSLYVDAQNNYWVGTLGNGLNIFNGTTFLPFTMKEGMFDDVIFQILEDDFQRMWFSCNKGIFQVERSQFFQVIGGSAKHVTYTAYGKENGMNTSECNGGTSPAGWKTRSGHLWFPTSRGVTMVDPKNITINTQPPLVVIEDLIIDNQAVAHTSAAVIPPGRERFEFRFTGLSFDSPKKVRFKVMLEGYDKGWDDIRYRRAAYYSYLPPGEYTFRVIAANGDGVWNMEGASFPFIVQAHFYETRMFYFAVAVTLTLLTLGIYRWRMRTLRARQEELERLVEERTKNLTEANNAKSQLLSFVAHDLKTPLITINSIAQEIKRFEVDKHFRGYLDLVEQNSKRIVTLISEILNITAIESGKFQFKMEPINIADIAGMVVDGYQVQAQRKDQVLRYTVDGHEYCTVMADSGKMQEAMENLVNNAIKYSPRGAAISVNVTRNNGTIRFSVNDQGPGISDEEKEQLFKKFTVLSAKPTGGEIATGLGLAIVKEIIDAHKGKIFVVSQASQGSTFVIELDRHA